MAAIKSLDAISAKWARVTPQRAVDYTEGVRNPGKDWAINTGAAETAYEGGVQAAIGNKSFGKGVRKAGTAKWQAAALAKGSARFGPGVAVAEPAYASGFAPYRTAIANVKLPERYARRDPRNMQRVTAVVDALVAAKEVQMRSP